MATMLDELPLSPDICGMSALVQRPGTFSLAFGLLAGIGLAFALSPSDLASAWTWFDHAILDPFARLDIVAWLCG